MKEGPPLGIERYRPIIPAWDLFVAASSRPLPHVIRVNTLRIAPERLLHRLLSQGIGAVSYTHLTLPTN